MSPPSLGGTEQSVQLSEDRVRKSLIEGLGNYLIAPHVSMRNSVIVSSEWRLAGFDVIGGVDDVEAGSLRLPSLGPQRVSACSRGELVAEAKRPHTGSVGGSDGWPNVSAKTVWCRDEGASGLSWKRKNGTSACLALPQLNGAGAPVDVLEPELGDLAGPQPQ